MNPRLAMCPFCDLPHAELLSVATPSGAIDIVSTECQTRSSRWLQPGCAVLMTDNHDQGDEDAVAP